MDAICERDTCRMRQEMTQRHNVLAVRAELGNVRDDSLIDVERAPCSHRCATTSTLSLVNSCTIRKPFRGAA